MAKHNAVTTAAEGAGKALERFQATETFAQRLFRPEGGKSVQAVFAGGNLHVVLTDGATTLEVSGGKAALSISQAEE